MNTAALEDARRAAQRAPDSSSPRSAEYVIARWIVISVWRRLRFLAAVTGLGVLIAIGIVSLLPGEYSSTARLMPPDQQSLSHTSVLSGLAGGQAFSPMMAAGLMSSNSPGAILIGILSSQTVQDDLIARFNLRQVYHCKLYEDARKTLAKRSDLSEDRKSGIVSITVTDHDPKRARAIAQAYIEELDKLVNSLNDSAAQRERIFLQGRLSSIQSDLEASSRALSEFSSKHATLDVQRQGQATVEAAGRLQDELISAQAGLSGLRAIYADENVRVREAEGRVKVLRRQLEKIQGIEGKSPDVEAPDNPSLPSVRELPLLGVTYYDLSRRVSTEESLYQTLTRQFELAKVEEAKETPIVRVLDQPLLPERKSSPSVWLFAAVGFSVSTVLAMAWILLSELWNTADDSHPVKADLLAVFYAVRGRSTSAAPSPMRSGGEGPLEP